MTIELWELVARESVRDTLAGYHAAGDRGRLDELAACFHPDGVLEVVGDEPMRGRAAIRDGLGARLAERRRPATAGDAVRAAGTPEPTGGDGRAVAATRVRHHLATPHFQQVTPTEIRTSSYFAVLTDVGLDHWGRYTDVLTPDDDGVWLLRRRVVTVEGHAPDSHFRA